MNLDLTHFLPKAFLDFLLCYTFADCRVVESAPDIITCTSNGYIYELKNKKIISSLKVVDEKCSQISCHYLFEYDKCVLFYLAFTETNKLLFIRKIKNVLQLVKVITDIQEFDVYDFMSLGFPQLKICTSPQYLLTKFPVEEVSDSFKINSTLSNDLGDKQYNLNSKCVLNSLNDKLQIINNHVDKLTEEHRELNKICFMDKKSSYLSTVHVSQVVFSAGAVEFSDYEITIIDTWYQLISSHIVLGLKICNSGKKAIHKVQLLIGHQQDLQKYSFKCFSLPQEIQPEPWFSPTQTSIKPENVVFIVGAFQIPAFVLESKLAIKYHLTTSKFCLKKGTLDLNVLELVKNQEAHLEYLTVENVMAIITVNKEVTVTIKTQIGAYDGVESIFVKKLTFRKTKNTESHIFYCKSLVFGEMYIVSRKVKPNVWQLRIFASENSQFYCLINALYDLLPEKTTIVIKESKKEFTADCLFEDLKGNGVAC